MKLSETSTTPCSTPDEDSSEGENQSAVVLVHRTSAARAGGPWGFDTFGVLERTGARDSKYFVLGPDGSYDLELNRFGRDLESWGVPSDNGHEGYMRDLMLYCRFLHESRGGKSIWDTDGNDLRAYKTARMRMNSEDTIAAATWKRAIAALDKWVKWSLSEGLLMREPFRYVDKTVMTPQGAKRVRVDAQYNVDDDKEPPERKSRLRRTATHWRPAWARGLARGFVAEGSC